MLRAINRVHTVKEMEISFTYLFFPRPHALCAFVDIIDILYNKFLDTALPFIYMAKTVTSHHRMFVYWLSRWPPTDLQIDKLDQRY